MVLRLLQPIVTENGKLRNHGGSWTHEPFGQGSAFCPHLMKDHLRFSSSNGNAEINKLETALGSIPLANQADRTAIEDKIQTIKECFKSC